MRIVYGPPECPDGVTLRLRLAVGPAVGAGPADASVRSGDAEETRRKPGEGRFGSPERGLCGSEPQSAAQVRGAR
jgi:hypothetical protein